MESQQEPTRGSAAGQGARPTRPFAGWEAEWRGQALPLLASQAYDDGLGLRVPGFGTLKETNRVNALPGGIVVVPLSLFEAVDDEAGFAAGIARAVAHVRLRHFERTVARWPMFSRVPPPPLLIFSRLFEREADYERRVRPVEKALEAAGPDSVHGDFGAQPVQREDAAGLLREWP